MWYLGRRPSTFFLECFAGVTLVMIMFTPSSATALLSALPQLGKFFLTAVYGGIYVYTAEIFPTTIKNSGIGICRNGWLFKSLRTESTYVYESLYSSNKFDRSNRRSCFSNYRNDSKNVWRRFNYGLYQNSICNLWYYDHSWLHTYVCITRNQRSKLSWNDIRRKSIWKGTFYLK